MTGASISLIAGEDLSLSWEIEVEGPGCNRGLGIQGDLFSGNTVEFHWEEAQALHRRDLLGLEKAWPTLA